MSTVEDLDGVIERCQQAMREFGNLRSSLEEGVRHERQLERRRLVSRLVGDFGHTSSPPPEEVAILRDSLPSFAVDTIAGAGHFLHEEQPAAVVERILRTTLDRRTAHAAGLRTRERAAP